MLQIDNGKHAFDLGLKAGAAAPLDTARALPDTQRLERHLTWIEDQGLVEFDHKPGGLWTMRCITAHGHAFLNAAPDGITEEHKTMGRPSDRP